MTTMQLQKTIALDIEHKLRTQALKNDKILRGKDRKRWRHGKKVREIVKRYIQNRGGSHDNQLMENKYIIN